MNHIKEKIKISVTQNDIDKDCPKLRRGPVLKRNCPRKYCSNDVQVS